VNVALKRADLLSETARLDTTGFATDAVAGLSGSPKRLPPKYFYDSAGSELFEKITELPEYYPTRTEIGILNEHAKDITALIPKGAALIEFGSGASTKTRIVLRAAQIASYVPVDISGEFLAEQAEALKREFPHIAMLPVAADFTRPFELPATIQNQPRVGFFPGSTIGNFEPHEAAAFLKEAGDILGPGSMLIVGVDLVKDQSVLQKAYNDSQRVTAKFNLNLLTRMNRELGANFNLATFEHHAFFNRERSCIEMHLASKKRQRVIVAGEGIDFRAGETIHTENSYKYTVETFGCMARGAGWMPTTVWTDKDKYFSVHVLTREGSEPEKKFEF
jgi:dimethylhistidine N-methyltransferase